MEFTKTELKDAFLISPKKVNDHRGFFTRAWCREEFMSHGLNPDMTQLNVGFSHRAGTLRGMHFQAAPHAEAKFVRCTRGAIFDVIVDLRESSPNFGQWLGVELAADNCKMLYVPEGFAHGYQTLVDDAEMYYLTTCGFAPGSARGVRYDDPAFQIEWPLPVTAISAADQNWPDWILA